MATDIGSIRFTIEADSSQVNSARSAIEGLQSGTIKATRATGEFSQSYARLRAQIDPAYRAQQQYNQAIKVLDAELARGTIGLSQYSKNVQQLRNNTLGLVGAANGVRGSFRPMGNSVQQVGFQVGDFATQVAGGQSALVAFGQQASQLAGIFGPGGALLGAVIAIGAAIGGAFVRGMGEGEEATKSLRERIDELNISYDELTKNQREALLLEQRRNQQETDKKIARQREELEKLQKVEENLLRLREMGEDDPMLGDVFNEQDLRDTQDRITELEGNIDTLEQKSADASDSLKDFLSGAGGDATQEVNDLADSLRVQAETLGLNERQLALYEAERLAANGADAEAVQLAKQQINASFDRIEAYKAEEEQLKALLEQTKITASEDPLLGRVAAEDRGQKIIDDLRKEAEATKRGLDEKYAIEQEYAERVRSLRDGLRTGVIQNEEELNNLIVQARTERNNQLSELERNSLRLLTESQEQALGFLGSAFGNFAEIAKQGGEKSFDEYKAFASAEAAIAASLAAIRALAEGGPFFGPILAASIAGLAAVQIANIQQQDYSGARADGGQVQGGASYLVGERGPELFTPGVTGQISNNKSMAANDGSTVVNIYNAPQGTRTEERTDSNGNRFVDVFVADMANGGPMSRSIQTTYGVRRQGR